MNTPEPVVVGPGRYRLHHVRCGMHLCWQVEWQRNHRTLKRRSVRTSDGSVLEYLSAPPWESSATLFAEMDDAVAFAMVVLEAKESPVDDSV